MDINGKKLYRSTKNRMVAGVCGGLEEYTGVDATIWRLLFVLVFFAGAAGFIAYIAMWLIVPEQRS